MHYKIQIARPVVTTTHWINEVGSKQWHIHGHTNEKGQKSHEKNKDRDQREAFYSIFHREKSKHSSEIEKVFIWDYNRNNLNKISIDCSKIYAFTKRCQL